MPCRESLYGVGGCCDDLSLHCMYASIEVGGEELVAPPCPVLVRALEESLYVRFGNTPLLVGIASGSKIESPPPVVSRLFFYDYRN